MDACGKTFKDGTDAVHVISQAIVVMANFKEHKIPLQLVRVKETNIMLTFTKHPETSVQKSDRSIQCSCSIAILKIMKEDTEKEMMESIADDQANQVEYEKRNGPIAQMLDVQGAPKVEMDKELEDLEQNMQDTQEVQEGLINDLPEARVSEGIFVKIYKTQSNPPRSVLPALCWQALGRWPGSDPPQDALIVVKDVHRDASHGFCVEWSMCSA